MKITDKHLILVFSIIATIIFIFGFIVSLAIWVIVPMKIPSNQTFLYLVFSSVVFFIAMNIGSYNFTKVDLSIIGPLTQTKTLFSLMLSFIFLGEVFQPITYFWISIIMIGGAIVSMDEKFNIKSLFTYMIFFVLLSNLAWSITDISSRKILDELDVWNANAWRMFIMSPLGLLTLPFIKKEERLVKKRVLIQMMSSFVLADILGTFFILSAFNLGTVTLSNAFAMMRGLLIIMITFVISKFRPEMLENHPTKVYIVRFVGSVLMVLAAIQLL